MFYYVFICLTSKPQGKLIICKFVFIYFYITTSTSIFNINIIVIELQNHRFTTYNTIRCFPFRYISLLYYFLKFISSNIFSRGMVPVF